MPDAKSRTKENLVLIARDVRPDAKRRVTLGKALADIEEDVRFDVYRNDRGQIVLDPQVSVPASEAWLYRNPEALASVRRGLQESAAGKTVFLGSFAQSADEE
jgi:hypothetical protein